MRMVPAGETPVLGLLLLYGHQLTQSGLIQVRVRVVSGPSGELLGQSSRMSPDP